MGLFTRSFIILRYKLATKLLLPILNNYYFKFMIKNENNKKLKWLN